ncbi:MAG: energy transducer TonB [Agriterribacter sp.]
MDVQKILNSNILDIVFDERNKIYGAYELRTKYNGRLKRALGATASLALLIMLASFLNAKFESKKTKTDLVVKEVEMVDLKKDEKVEPPLPLPKPIEQPRIEMARVTTPIIEKDELVKPEDEMKNIEDLTDTKIGLENVKGEKDLGIVAPPIEEKSGVIEGPKVDEEDKTFLKVEIEATFPGGEEAWRKYISREMNRYIDELQEDGKAGTCLVQFIVDKEGNISDVEALTMKGTKLAEICTNAIKKGPKWTPALQNKQHVRAYRKQPVTFQMPEQ